MVTEKFIPFSLFLSLSFSLSLFLYELVISKNIITLLTLCVQIIYDDICMFMLQRHLAVQQSIMLNTLGHSKPLRREEYLHVMLPANLQSSSCLANGHMG